MLADQDEPLADDPGSDLSGADEPRVMVVYRSRGIPWLLIPPLLILSAVASIVVYRRSERPSVSPIVVSSPSQPRDSKPAVETAPPTVSKPAVGEVPPPKEPIGEPATARVADIEKSNPATIPAQVPSPDLPAPVDSAIAQAPFDVQPRVATPADLLPPPTEPERRDVVGFDPGASRATLAGDAPGASPSGVPPRDKAPAQVPLMLRRPGPQPSPPADPPALLGPRLVAPADGKPASNEILAGISRDAEGLRADRRRLEDLKPELLKVDPRQVRAQRREIAELARRTEAERRVPFHQELREILAAGGARRGEAVQDLCERFGRTCQPEILLPANRDLTGPAASLSTSARIARMRRWGLPETYLLDDLVEKETNRLRTPGGPRTKDDVWIFAARRLLSMPPEPYTPREQAKPAASTGPGNEAAR
jgi:hypothetical protein